MICSTYNIGDPDIDNLNNDHYHHNNINNDYNTTRYKHLYRIEYLL